MTEIFQNFEINKTPWWERVWPIVTGSILVHTFFLIAVLYIPAVRDAVNIAGMLTGIDYVDKDYKKTEIRDEVTMLDMRERFEYPPGYFQTDAPPQLDPMVITPVAVQPPSYPNIKPVPMPVPTPGVSPSPATQPANGQNAVASASPSPAPAQDIEKQAQKLASEKKIEEIDENAINKRPLKDALIRYNERKNKGELDLSQNIELTIEAELKPGGKLENARVVQKSGDPRLIEAAKDLVAAISDSNVLFFLQDNKNPEIVKQLVISIKVDQQEVTATLSSEVSSELNAQVMKYIYTGLINKGKEKKKGQDEEIIFNSTNISTKGKQIIVNFKMPRPTAEAMLKKQLPAT